MKKVFNWISKNRCKIFVVLAIIVIAINVLPIDAINNAVYAEINQIDNNHSSGEGLGDDIMGVLLNTASGLLTGPIAQLVTVIGVLLFTILYLVFQTTGMSANWYDIPFPDDIVFNRLAFFDPNFINPPTTASGITITDSPVAVMKDIISDMYYSFFILAGTIFVIAAMVIGIKLALSTLATQKAQYKSALTNWVMGVVLLFTVHFLMAGIFYINEQIVEAAYSVVQTSKLEFPLDIFETITGASSAGLGRTIGSIISSVGRGITGNPDWGTRYLPGYGGYIVTLLANGISGDLVSAIIVCILLGQTIALIVTYTKRLFYCIILGMMAPIIVAVDVIKKSMV